MPPAVSPDPLSQGPSLSKCGAPRVEVQAPALVFFLVRGQSVGPAKKVDSWVHGPTKGLKI